MAYKLYKASYMCLNCNDVILSKTEVCPVTNHKHVADVEEYKKTVAALNTIFEAKFAKK